MTASPSITLGTPLTALRGIGSERAAQLARLKVHTLGDLLLLRPRRLEDRRHWKHIAELALKEPATVRGRVVAAGLKTYRRGTRSVFEVILDDGSARLHCRWWNMPFMERYFHVGDEVFAFGKASHLKPRTFDHPETEVVTSEDDASIHLNRIVPVYPLTEGLPQRWLRATLWRVLRLYSHLIQEPWPGLDLGNLPSRCQAVRWMHFPEEMEQAELARQRLALDEFIELQLHIQRRRRNLQRKARGLPCGGTNQLIRPFLRALGFALTEAQMRVLRELRRDMSGPYPMRRLVQGDVGSGKTVVAACCALMAIESGYHVALMAPTEILAEQHFRNFRRWFEPLGVPVHLQTGSTKTYQPAAGDQLTLPAGKPAQKTPAMFVGTHALIESGFAVEPLGLVIIDEQHKFGVAQRERLVRKGRYPHVLIMTATPIPRTLGLTLYGDLDVSVLDQMPPGRGRIRTFLRTADKLPKVWEFIRGQLEAGRQAYIIYPRVEDSGDAGNIKAVTSEYERVKEGLAPWRVGLLHGGLRPEEKDRVMEAFRANTIQALLATSIVEVGMDVPNATVMLIENAECFGLAQLHQLRGRIGRGTHDAYCILVTAKRQPEILERLRLLERTHDGFEIAEADLRLRGPGELLGRQQSGLPPLRFGDLRNDLKLVQQARDLARQWLDQTEPDNSRAAPQA